MAGALVDVPLPTAVLLTVSAVRAGLAIRTLRAVRERRVAPSELVVRSVRDVALGSVAVAGVSGLAGFTSVSGARTLVAAEAAAALVLMSALAFAAAGVTAAFHRSGWALRRVVVIGSTPSAEEFVRIVDANPETGYRVVAHLDDCALLASDDPLADLAAALEVVGADVSEVVLATSVLRGHQLQGLLTQPRLRGAAIHALPDLHGVRTTKLASGPAIAGIPVVSLVGEPASSVLRPIKRAVDIIGASIATLLLSPVVAVAAVAVRLSSPGPVLFRQERLGLDGRPFQVFKFRTMRVANDDAHHRRYMLSLIDGATGDDATRNGLYKLVDDPRITSVGRVLRRFSIDELPQLFNVLRGEMSLVGPRPPLAYEVDAYAEWQRPRLDIRPGMTGLWQVSGRNRLTFSEMVELDLSYIDRWSPAVDLSIMARTLPAVLRRDGS